MMRHTTRLGRGSGLLLVLLTSLVDEGLLALVLLLVLAELVGSSDGGLVVETVCDTEAEG
jgi:hypothetical protein